MCSVSRLRRASECYYIVMHIQLQGGETLGSRVRQRPLSIEYGLEEEEGGRPADNSLLMNREVDFSKGQTELCCFTHLHSAQLSSTQLDSAQLSSTQLTSNEPFTISNSFKFIPKISIFPASINLKEATFVQIPFEILCNVPCSLILFLVYPTF